MALTTAGATLATGIIGGASSLLGNLFGFGSNSKTNETNLKIAQMNNEFNERMLQKQMDYNDEMFGKQTEYDQKKMQQQNDFTREMWNANNEYNSAANQRKRLEEAGLNPYLMMNGGSAGTAIMANGSGSGGSPSAQGVNPPTATPVQVQAYRPDFSGINQVIASYMDYLQHRDVNAATAKQLQIGNETLGQRLVAQLVAMTEGTEKTRAETKNISTQTGRALALLPHEINQARWSWQNAQMQNAVMQGDLVNSYLDANLKQKTLDTYDERFRAEMSVYAADIFAKYAAGQLSQKEAELAVEKKLTEIETRNGIKIDNKTKQDMQKHLVDGAKWNAVQGLWKANSIRQTLKQQKQDYYNPFRYVGSLLGGVGAALIK